MRTITIKKTDVAMLKGLGKTTEDMANNFGITKNEMAETLIEFGLTKSRKTPKEYKIVTIDDVVTKEVEEVVNNEQLELTKESGS